MSATDLYPRILERHWEALPETLRRFYAGAPSARATGRLEIERGADALSRLLGWLWGMPPRGAQVETELHVARSGARETWSRRFGAHVWITHQELGPLASLAERRGPIEVWMRLSSSDGILRFASIGGALRIAGARVPLPAWLLPHVEARSWAEPGAPDVHLCVTLSAAHGALVARYAGSVRGASEAQTQT